MNDPARHTRRELHRKERRARKQADCTLRATVRALGAGDLEDWIDDDKEDGDEG